MDYKELLISKDISIQETLVRMNSTAKRILFIEDGGVLTAAVVDGDIRRYIIGGGRLDDPIDAAGNHNPITACSHEEARRLLEIKKCIAIPVLDSEGHILDIYIENGKEQITGKKLSVPVVINAGGKGTRLDPYTKILPKPLIPVGDLPIIEHILQRYILFGCDEFHIIVNHKRELIKSYFEECDNSYNITFYDEDKPLHTGGGLYLLKGKLDKTFFFNNCDTLIQADYSKILDVHTQSGNAVTMVCAEKNVTLDYGVVEISGEGAITALKEKPHFSFATNTGMYVVEPNVLDSVEDNVPQKFTDIIERQRAAGRRAGAYKISEEQWLDMGTVPELERMRERLYGEK